MKQSTSYHTSYRTIYSRLPKKLFCLLHWKCSLKIMKNAFYFTLKVLFLFKILRFFVSTFWKFEIRKLQEYFWNAWNWWRVPCRLPKWKNLLYLILEFPYNTLSKIEFRDLFYHEIFFVYFLVTSLFVPL